MVGTISNESAEREQVLLSGQLTATTLIELLRTAEGSRSDTVVQLETALGQGYISFQAGELFDARMGSLEGSAALKSLLQADVGRFEVVRRAVDGTRTLRGSVIALAAHARSAADGQNVFSASGIDGRRAKPAEETAAQAPRVNAAPAATPMIGPYEVLCRIARGGMGAVFLCRLRRGGGFERLFALKMLPDRQGWDPGVVQEFMREARLGGRFQHPNLIAVLDTGVHAGQPYFVMQYVEGASLKRLLQRSPESRPPRLLLPVAIDALHGLSAAHSLRDALGRPQPLVHCDVSPENLLVGVDGVCRVADFGIAQRSHAGSPSHGKPAYLSPEVASGGAPDARSDIFAMGVVLYNALTGVELFRAVTQEQVLDNVMRQPIPPPSTVGLRPPPGLDAVLMKALQRDPDRRFGSAEEMLVELRRAAVEADLLAPPSELTGWVERLAGPELAQRRMAALGETHGKLPATRLRREDLAARAARAAISPSPKVDRGGTLDEPVTTRALRARRLREPALIAASIAALAIIGITLAWPDGVRDRFVVSGASARSPNDLPRARPRRAPTAPAASAEDAALLELLAPPTSSDEILITPAGPSGSSGQPEESSLPRTSPQPEEKRTWIP